MDIIFFNTLGREKQVFNPIVPGKAGMYTCGPTVYNFQHIGNFRTFLFEDFLKRVLLYNDYDVNHIINITDVGHLVSDDDEGEDKMEKGSAREGKSVWEIAEYYTGFYMNDAKLLNILPPTNYTKATDYIPEQIAMVQCLEDKGYTYKTSDGIYFDTSKLSDYGKLANLDIEGLEEGKRIEFSSEKKNKTDFALWKFSPKDQKRQMEWDSHWGRGFPGWHIECSAMSKKFLGETFDIHCGGIDHIPIHHTNEIAQSEACNGKPFVHYWLHGAFLEDEGKMSKSKGEFITVKTLTDRGYSPLDYRYLCLGTHYRKRLLFSWEGLDAAKSALARLRSRITEIKKNIDSDEGSRFAEDSNVYANRFLQSINDDLNMPQALAVLWDMLKSGMFEFEKLELVNKFDKVLGLELNKAADQKITLISKETSTVIIENKLLEKMEQIWPNAKIEDQLETAIYPYDVVKDSKKKLSLFEDAVKHLKINLEPIYSHSSEKDFIESYKELKSFEKYKITISPSSKLKILIDNNILLNQYFVKWLNDLSDIRNINFLKEYEKNLNKFDTNNTYSRFTEIFSYLSQTYEIECKYKDKFLNLYFFDEFWTKTFKKNTQIDFDYYNTLGITTDARDAKNVTILPRLIIKWIIDRVNAKADKNFILADNIRENIKEKGFELVDKKENIEIRKLY